LNQHRGPKKEKSYSTIVKSQTTMTWLNNDTQQEGRKRMQRHANPTVRPNEQPTRWMQKWVRLNIHRLKSRIARHKTSEVGQLTVPLVTRSDNQRVHPGVRRQKIEDRRRDQKKNSSRMDEPYSPSDPSMDSSSEEEVVLPRHIMKPPKFDGQCSFETFMVQFSNCAEYNKWNEVQKLAH